MTRLEGRTALVVARDAMIGALMASLVELVGFTAIVPAAGESVENAVRRLAPTVVLLDWDDDEATHPDVYGRAAERGSRVVLFTASRTAREIRREAAAIGVPTFALPIHPTALDRVLRVALDARDRTGGDVWDGARDRRRTERPAAALRADQGAAEGG